MAQTGVSTGARRMRELDGADRFSRVSWPANILISALFILLAFICFMPMIFVLVISFSSEMSVTMNGYTLFPSEWAVTSYEWLLNQKDTIARCFFNSIFITVCGTLLGLFLTSTMGYVLSRRNFKLRGLWTGVIFIPMLFGGGLTATYMINTQLLGMKNTYFALILPLACSSFNIIIMRTFFQTTVPDSIVESAKIDGARQLLIYAKIVMPISLPAIATIGLFLTFAYWNDWYQALLYIDTNASQLYPLQYQLIKIEDNIQFLAKNAQYMSAGAQTAADMPNETIRMAIVMVVVLPIACSYPFFQRYIISGLTIGAVKG